MTSCPGQLPSFHGTSGKGSHIEPPQGAILVVEYGQGTYIGSQELLTMPSLQSQYPDSQTRANSGYGAYGPGPY